ncbi:MAG: hypothetical protein AB7O60_11930 [Variibacter sp.]
MTKKPEDRYTPKETDERMKAALRGARISGHKSMSEIAPKRIISQRKKKLQGKLGPKGPSQD